jgi:hypothetical protein
VLLLTEAPPVRYTAFSSMMEGASSAEIAGTTAGRGRKIIE